VFDYTISPRHSFTSKDAGSTKVKTILGDNDEGVPKSPSKVRVKKQSYFFDDDDSDILVEDGSGDDDYDYGDYGSGEPTGPVKGEPK